MFSSFVVDVRILDGVLILLMAGHVAILMELQPVFVSFLNLGLLFTFSFLCHAPMTCIWLGVFGANTLLLGLTCDEYSHNQASIKFPNSDPARSRLRKVLLRGMGLSFGALPLFALQNISAQQIIRLGTACCRDGVKKSNVSDSAFLLSILGIFFALGLLAVVSHFQSRRR